MVDFASKLKGKRSAKPSEQKAIAKAAVGSDPRLPDYMRGNPAAPPARHITEYPDLVDCLPDMAVRYRELLDTIKPLEAEKKELGKDINALLDAVGVKAIRGDGWLATYVDGGNIERIVPERLLELGLTLEDIEAATERKPKAGYVQVTAPKG